MLDKLWSVHKVSMYKPYRDLTEVCQADVVTHWAHLPSAPAE